MNNKLVCFTAFVIGGAIGSIATWQLIKTKYEQIAMEEIESVKEVYTRKQHKLRSEPSSDDDSKSDSMSHSSVQFESDADVSIKDYAERLSKEGYIDYTDLSDISVEEKPEPSSEESFVDETIDISDTPYVIPPERFGELDEYTTISLTYYADNILADEDDRYIDNVDDIVGRESLEHFGEYEDDSVFVRNDRLKCDYEILLDQRNYSDVINMKPHVMED